MKKILAILILPLLFSACEDKQQNYVTFNEQLEIDKVLIDNYIEDNNITNVIKDPSGVSIVIHQQGVGDAPSINNLITVEYKGSLLEDETEVFDEGFLTAFSLSSSIQGWQIAFPYLKDKGGDINNLGAIATIYIPSGYAYGRGGSANIPQNAVLIFDVELINVL